MRNSNYFMKYLLEGQETERLLFRKLEQGDFYTWLEFFKNPSSNEHWISETTDPEIQCREWFEKTFNRYSNDTGGMNVLIDRRSGAFIGQCGLLLQTVDKKEELEIGYSILPAFWKQGYATEAAIKCKYYAFANNLRESLISIIHEKNIGSQKVATNNGMVADKRTIYYNNPVIIYRVNKTW